VSPSGVQTIGVGTDASAAGIPLPVLIRTVTLDGTTEPGASGSPVIGVALDGTSAGATANGLEAEAAVTIKGVDVEKFHGTGLRLDSTPASSSNSTLQGNVVGANASGTAAAANGGGMLVNSSSNTIKRNVVSGNGVGGAIVVAGTANDPNAQERGRRARPLADSAWALIASRA